jgi:hypothetical protein
MFKFSALATNSSVALRTFDETIPRGGGRNTPVARVFVRGATAHVDRLV